MPTFILQILSWSPVLFGVIGALVLLFTGLQALFVAVSVIWPGAKAWAAELGTLALDLQRIAGWLQGLLSAMSKMTRSLRGPRGPSGGATVGLVLVAMLCSSCAAFGKFSPGTSQAVSEACTVLDSGNQTIGALCLTAEEVTSIFSHVKTTRAHMKVVPTEVRTVDICEAQ